MFYSAQSLGDHFRSLELHVLRVRDSYCSILFPSSQFSLRARSISCVSLWYCPPSGPPIPQSPNPPWHFRDVHAARPFLLCFHDKVPDSLTPLLIFTMALSAGAGGVAGWVPRAPPAGRAPPPPPPILSGPDATIRTNSRHDGHAHWCAGAGT